MALRSFLGLKQEEGVTRNIESEPTKKSIREIVCAKVRAILSQHKLYYVCSKHSILNGEEKMWL